MLSGGLRLLLAVAAPLLGAALVHELRVHRRACLAATVVTGLSAAALALSLVPAVAGGGSLERSFGSAVPGVALTARADTASVAVMLIACLAALLAVPRHRGDGERLAGILLCLGGAGLVAAAGNLALLGGGVEVIAAGTLLLRGGHGPGARSTMVIATLIGVAGLALAASAAQLVAGAGSSDLAFLPPAALTPAVAVPWALGGAALLVSPAILGAGGRADRDWAAIAALPAGFLVLLRLQLSAGELLPGAAAVALGTAGGVVAAAAVLSGRRSTTLAAAGRMAVAVLTATLVSLFGGILGADGTVLAGLFLAIELALLAAPSWNLDPTVWSAAALAGTALPGGAAFAVVAVGLGGIARRGVAWFPLLLVLSCAVAVVAVAAVRAVLAPPRRRRPLLPGAVIGVVAGVAGGFLPGAAVGSLAGPLAGGGRAADIDAGTLALPGGGFAAGYFATAAAVLLVAVSAATVLAAEAPPALPAAPARSPGRPQLGLLLRLRRTSRSPLAATAGALHRLDRWLEGQPGVAFLLVAVVLALLLVH